MRFRNVLLASTALLALGAGAVYAGPEGPVVVGGSATVSGAGTSSTVINQNTNRAIINWNTFNIDKGKTVNIDQEQGALHILVNDIWGATPQSMEWDKTVWESTLDVGLRTLRLGVDTHAITSHFALPLLIRTPGGLVVEMTDGTDEYNATNYRVSFFYDLAKAAVNRMAFSLAHELEPHGGTAVALSPGWLRSEAMLDAYGVTEATWRDATKISPHFAISESPAYVGRAVVALAADPDVSRWSGQTLSSGQLAQVYDFTDLDGSQPDAWRYMPEVQDAGKPADTTGYR